MTTRLPPSGAPMTVRAAQLRPRIQAFARARGLQESEAIRRLLARALDTEAGAPATLTDDERRRAER